MLIKVETSIKKLLTKINLTLQLVRHTRHFLTTIIIDKFVYLLLPQVLYNDK